MWTERGHRIRTQVADDHALLDALRVLLPAYNGEGLTLYQGESIDRWRRQDYGSAWTRDAATTRMFAEGLK